MDSHSTNTHDLPGITINEDQQLYVIKLSHGYSCLGFQVCEERYDKLAVEMTLRTGMKHPFPAVVGTLARYSQYQDLTKAASQYSQATGYKFQCELTPQLKGLERKRVEVVDAGGHKRRFIVGRSSGWMPCHLEIKRRDSTGGMATYGAPFRSVRVV